MTETSKGWNKTIVCDCVCQCLCGLRVVCRCACMCPWRSEVTWVSFPGTVYLDFEREVLVSWSLLNRVGWLANKTQESACLCLARTRIAMHATTPGLSPRFWGWNSGQTRLHSKHFTDVSHLLVTKVKTLKEIHLRRQKPQNTSSGHLRSVAFGNWIFPSIYSFNFKRMVNVDKYKQNMYLLDINWKNMVKWNSL